MMLIWRDFLMILAVSASRNKITLLSSRQWLSSPNVRRWTSCIKAALRCPSCCPSFLWEKLMRFIIHKRKKNVWVDVMLCRLPNLPRRSTREARSHTLTLLAATTAPASFSLSYHNISISIFIVILPIRISSSTLLRDIFRSADISN